MPLVQSGHIAINKPQNDSPSVMFRKVHEAPGAAAGVVGKHCGRFIHHVENAGKKLINEVTGKEIYQPSKIDNYSVKVSNVFRNIVRAVQYTCQFAAKVAGLPGYVAGYFAGRVVGLAIGAAIVGSAKVIGHFQDREISTRSINAYSAMSAQITSSIWGLATSGGVSGLVMAAAPSVGIPILIGSLLNIVSEIPEIMDDGLLGDSCAEDRKKDGWPPMPNMPKFLSDHDPWVQLEREKSKPALQEDAKYYLV